MEIPLSIAVAEGVRAAGYRDDGSYESRGGRSRPVFGVSPSAGRDAYVVYSARPGLSASLLGGTWAGLLGAVLVNPEAGTVRVEVAGRGNEAAMSAVRDAVGVATGLDGIPLVLGCE